MDAWACCGREGRDKREKESMDGRARETAAGKGGERKAGGGRKRRGRRGMRRGEKVWEGERYRVEVRGVAAGSYGHQVVLWPHRPAN